MKDNQVNIIDLMRLILTLLFLQELLRRQLEEAFPADNSKTDSSHVN